MKLGTAFVEVRPDTKGFRRDLEQQTTQDAASVSRTLGQALAGGAFLAGAKKATDAASQLQQAVGGTAAVFGEAQEAVNDFARGAAESAGLSERAARELTSTLGGLLKGFGFTADEAANLSVELATLGADLAATFGGTPEEAVQALGAALRGETDPLERFGVALNQTLVNQRAVELGLAATTAKVDQQAKAQATLSLITERSADAQGQFAREADTAAGQAAIAAAKAENSAADLGENLLPIYTKLAETVGFVADAFGALPEPVQTAVIALAGIAALSGPVTTSVAAIGALATITRTKLVSGFETAALRGLYLRDNLGKVAAGAGIAGGALGLLAIAVTTAQDRAEDFRQAVRELREEAERTGDSLEEVALRKLVRTFTESNQVTAAIDALGLSFEQLREPLHGSSADFDAWAESVSASAGQNTVLREQANLLIGRVAALRSELGAAEGTTSKAAEAAGDLGIETEGAAPKVADLTEKIDANEQAAKDAAESVDLFREAVEKALAPLDMQAAVDARTQALADIAASIDEREAAVADARRRISDLQAIKPEDRPDDFARQMADAQATLRDALDQTSLTLQGNSDAALRNREELRNLVDDSVGVIEAARDEGRSLDDLRLIRLGETEALRDQLTQMGFNREEIEVYIDAIEGIPLTRATTLTVETAKAQARIKELADSLQALDPQQQLSIDAAVIDRNLQRAAANANRAGYAAGGFPFDGDFLVHSDEVLRKRGSDLEVIAGPAPTALGGSLDTSRLEVLLVRLIESNDLIAGNTAGPTTGQRLRRVQTTAGAL